jgi:hypothetical protein
MVDCLETDLILQTEHKYHCIHPQGKLERNRGRERGERERARGRNDVRKRRGREQNDVGEGEDRMM